MNSAVELHDSESGMILQKDGRVVVCFSSAYIHKSEGTPGSDPGSGWTQVAELHLNPPQAISDGKLVCRGRSIASCIVVPFETKDSVESELLFVNGSALRITGQNAKLNLLGEPTYVEEFP